MDGAHTHHHRPGGARIGTALLIGAALAVADQVMHAAAAIVYALLIGLSAAALLALAGLIAFAVTAYRRRHAAWHQPARGPELPGPDEVPLAGDREVVPLRQAIAELHAQLVAARAALDSADLPETHQHVHFHGLDSAQVAAILAVYRRQGSDGQ
jgi:hypothetical protein